MALDALVETIETRQDLVHFIEALVRDLETNQQEWENPELECYLDALERWTESMDGYFHNVRGQPARNSLPGD
jgi:hypothetical protein